MAAVGEVFKEGVQGTRSLVKGLQVTMTNFWRAKVTRRYGEDEHPESWLNERFRGLHGLTYHPEKTYDDGSRYENCIGCLACAKVCPDSLITMVLEKRDGHSGRYPVAFQIDLNPCCICGLCSEVCPTPYKALLMTREFEIASSDRADLILTKDRLMELGDREFERLRRDHGELTEEISYKGWARSESKQEKRGAVAEKRAAGKPTVPAAKKAPARVAPRAEAAEASSQPSTVSTDEATSS